MSARRGIKAAADAVALVVVSPIALLYWLALRVAPSRADGAIQGFSQLLALVPGVVGVFLRRAFYRVALDRCPRACSIGFGTLIITPRVSIGDGTYIGENCNISHSDIGRDVLIGSNVSIVSGRNIHGTERLDVPMRHQPGTWSPVTVGEDVWIGNGAIVLADIGAHAVVAAGAVVVRPVEAYTIVGGNPAKVLGSRLEKAVSIPEAKSPRPSAVVIHGGP